MQRAGMDRNSVLFSLLLTALAFCSLTVSAQERELDRDPFFSAGPRAKATASPPHDGDWGRDPFSSPFEGAAQPSAPQGAPVSGIKLSGIIYGKDVRLAIISGEILRQGGKVGDRKLVDIRSRSVVLRSDSGEEEEVFLEDFSMGR